MFLTNQNTKKDGRVALIGEFVKIDQNYVIIRSNNELFKVQPRGFDNFKSKMLIVIGELKEGILIEDFISPIENNFDFEVFQRLVKVSMKYPEVF